MKYYSLEEAISALGRIKIELDDGKKRLSCCGGRVNSHKFLFMDSLICETCKKKMRDNKTKGKRRRNIEKNNDT